METWELLCDGGSEVCVVLQLIFIGYMDLCNYPFAKSANQLSSAQWPAGLRSRNAKYIGPKQCMCHYRENLRFGCISTALHFVLCSDKDISWAPSPACCCMNRKLPSHDANITTPKNQPLQHRYFSFVSGTVTQPLC